MAAVAADTPNFSLSSRARKPAASADFEMINMKGDGGQGFIITITEAEAPSLGHVPLPPKARVAGDQRSASPLPNQDRPSSPLNPSPTHSRSSSPKLVRSGSSASTGTHSPVMRSMFPRFDPRLPLAQQNYRPNLERLPGPPPIQSDSLGNYSPSMYSQSSPDLSQSQRPKNLKLWTGNNGPSFSTTSGPSFNSVQSTSPAPNCSTPKELLDLWSLTSGQKDGVSIETFIFGMDCRSLSPEREIIALTSSTPSTFYNLSASSSTLKLSRTNPLDPDTTINTTEPRILVPSPENPVIASVFPKLAELNALDQSSTISTAHKLDRKAAAQLQAEAVSRARAHEAASLLWDSDSDRYALFHPSLDNGAAVSFPINIESRSEREAHLIKIMPPHSRMERDGSIKHIRSPSEAEREIPILTLNLQEPLTLTLHTKHILAYKSLYTADTLLSTALILTLHLHRNNRVNLFSSSPSASNGYPIPSYNQQHGPSAAPYLALPLPTFAPPPTRLSLQAQPSSRRSSISSSIAGSLFRSKTNATTRTARTTRTALSHMSHARNLSDASTESAGSTTNSFANVKNSMKGFGGKEKTVDLSAFQPFNANDESLNGATRAALKVLYWGFATIVWMMGLCVGLLAAGIVGLGALVKRL